MGPVCILGPGCRPGLTLSSHNGAQEVVSRPQAGSKRGLLCGRGFGPAPSSCASGPIAGPLLGLHSWSRIPQKPESLVRFFGEGHLIRVHGNTDMKFFSVGSCGRTLPVGVKQCVQGPPHLGVNPCPGFSCASWTTSCWSPLTCHEPKPSSGKGPHACVSAGAFWPTYDGGTHVRTSMLPTRCISGECHAVWSRGSESPECRQFLLSLAWPSGRRCHRRSSGSRAGSAEAPWRLGAHDALVVDGAEAVRYAPRGRKRKGLHGSPVASPRRTSARAGNSDVSRRRGYQAWGLHGFGAQSKPGTWDPLGCGHSAPSVPGVWGLVSKRGFPREEKVQN